MPRLPRPLQPLSLKLTVALGQLGFSPDHVERQVEAAAEGHSLRTILDIMLASLAATFGCPVDELRLDHDPPLAAREKLIRLPSGRKAHAVVVPKGGTLLRYFPDANDPRFLNYRPHSSEYEGSHHIKTFIRGEHGQYSDVQIIKRQRRRDRKLKSRRKRKWPRRSYSS